MLQTGWHKQKCILLVEANIFAEASVPVPGDLIVLFRWFTAIFSGVLAVHKSVPCPLSKNTNYYIVLGLASYSQQGPIEAYCQELNLPFC